jgi:hypothetical protein
MDTTIDISSDDPQEIGSSDEPYDDLWPYTIDEKKEFHKCGRWRKIDTHIIERKCFFANYLQKTCNLSYFSYNPSRFNKIIFYYV